MDCLPKDILFEIVFDLPIHDLSHLAVTSKSTYSVLQDSKLWDKLYLRDFGDLQLFPPKPPPGPQPKSISLWDLDTLSKSIQNSKVSSVKIIPGPPQRLPQFPVGTPSFIRYQHTYEMFANVAETMLEACPINPEFLRIDLLSKRIQQKLIVWAINRDVSQITFTKLKKKLIKLVCPIKFGHHTEYGILDHPSRVVMKGILVIKDRFIDS